MKVMRGDFRRRQLERFDVACLYRHHAILVLQESLDLQEGMMDDDRVVTFKQLRCDDDVSHTGFVFETQKHKSFGCTRTLANDHRSHNLNWLTVGELL